VNTGGTIFTDGVEDAERALRDACGITLTEGLRTTLGEAFRRAARASGLDPDAFRAGLRARDPRCLAELIEAAVVGETYFFRHPEQLEAVREVLLQPTPRERPLRIWSAGCATGEEPYSLAMLLRDAGRAGCRDRILGTDVSARALAVAADGSYGAWSLRRIDPAARARHFEGEPPQVRVRDEVRAAVELRRHNLYSDPPPPGPFDLVVCRNVLIYFDPATAREIAARLLDAVALGGILLLGPVEVPLAEGLGAERIEVGGTTLLRRLAAGSLDSAPPLARRRYARDERGRGPPAPTERNRSLEAGHPERSDAASAAERSRGGSTATSIATSASTVISRVEPVREPGAAPEEKPGSGSGSGSFTGSLESSAAATSTPRFEEALDAARRGETEFAEQLAREVAERHMCPESYLLLAMAADARGDLGGAIDALRRALYLDPGLAMAHAALVPLYGRMARHDEAARARRNALEAVAGLDDGAPLRWVEPITAGALRRALGDPHRTPSRAGRSES
jgi:chemotaxis protein methyltransferase CheR